MVNNSTNINKTITTHHNSLITKETKAYDVENPGPDLGQGQRCGRFKPINVKPTIHS
jgi:hypothetical protein